MNSAAGPARAAALRGAALRMPGVVTVALVAAAAWVLAPAVPVVGSAVIALAAGVLVRNTMGVPAVLTTGVDFTIRRLLRLAIVLFGATLALGEVLRLGALGLTVIVVTVVLALGLTALAGRALRLPGRLVQLIGVGTAICGATAIVTIGPIVEARDDEIAFAVATIFLFNMLAVAVYPLLGAALGLGDRLYGIWTGAAIHDTSSVLAAAYTMSDAAGQTATVTKLTRTLLLVPLALGIAVVHTRARRRTGKEPVARVDLVRIFPWFILWFAAAAAVNSLGVLPPSLVRAASVGGKFLILMVMAAVGLGADVRAMRRIGLGPFYVGLAASVLIAVLSLSLIRLLVLR